MASNALHAADNAPVKMSLDIQNLKEKVDALIRSLQGSEQRAGIKRDAGLERALLWDGFDERTQVRGEPTLAKKQMIEHFSEAVSKLDEVGKLSSKLLGSMHGGKSSGTMVPAELPIVVVPAELPFNYGEIPSATYSILPPDVQASQDELLQAVYERINTSLPSPETGGNLIEKTKTMLQRELDDHSPTLNNIRSALQSVRGGAGSSKQARLSYEPGWKDENAENTIIAAIIGESGNAWRYISMCHTAGVRSIDFTDKDNRMCWEAIEKLRNAGQLSDRAAVETLLRKELGEAKKKYFDTKKQQGPCVLACSHVCVSVCPSVHQSVCLS
jgi:hypothetical protein